MKRIKKLGVALSVLSMVAALLVPGGLAKAITPQPAFTEFPVPSTPTSTYPTGMASGPDGAVWFVGYNLPYIGRLAMDGTVTQYSLSTVAKRLSIAAGPDGALWFTNPGTIGRITTAGVITEYPYSGGASSFITAGPDGALWVSAGTFIARVTVSGEVTEYPLAGSSNRIAVGSDGALWFSGSTRNSSGAQVGRIGRITTTGSITEYIVEASNITGGIAAGSDGALWFTTGPTIRRITTTGDITEYTAPSGQAPQDITGGPDSALWFTRSSGGIGYITTSGEAARLTSAASIYAISIMNGADGSLWVSDIFGKILRVDLGGGKVVSAAFDTNPKPVSQTPVTLTAHVNDPGAVSIVEYYDPVQQAWFEMSVDDFGVASVVIDTPAASYPAGMYPFLVRTQNPEGDISTPITVYLDVYNPAGGYAAGHGSITPNGASSNPGDTLPTVAGNNLKATLDFTVKYETPTSTVPTGPSVFTWGKSCNKPNNDCFVMTTDSLDWLIVPTTNDTATFQGHATLTLAGQNLGSNYPVRVSVSSGTTDHYLLRIYQVGANPDTASPLYQASGDLTGGQIVLHQ